MNIVQIMEATIKANRMNVENLIEDKDINISLLKKFRHYNTAMYEIRREISEGETCGFQWYKCCMNNCPALTNEEVKYINDMYEPEEGEFELEIYWSLNA